MRDVYRRPKKPVSEPPVPTIPEYTFCQSAGDAMGAVGSGSGPPWHIRKIGPTGQKFGSGIDTPFLCGRAARGWDLSVEITDQHMGRAHEACVRAYRKVVP